MRDRMGGGLVPAKLCDSCKSANATLFCKADTASLCLSCDSIVHAANKLASRHARVWLCEVCEHAPATVTCKADAAHLCPSCDRDIHSANPLARRHDRVPLSPFYDLASAADSAASSAVPSSKSEAICKLFGEDCYSSDDIDAEEAEAASWLLTHPNPNNKAADGHEPKSIDYLFAQDIDPYLDLEFGPDPKPEASSGTADGVVPDPDPKGNRHHSQQHSLFSLHTYNSSSHHLEGFDNSANGKPFSLYNSAQPALSHSVSSSSLDFGVVPDASVSTGMEKQMKGGIDREARVLRYREKRKNRKFEKTIRYASRKAYAETRPRIKGRFAKRTDMEAEVVTANNAAMNGLFGSSQGMMQDAGYGIVPSF